MPYYLPIAAGRIIGFIPFPSVLVLCKMQYIYIYIYMHELTASLNALSKKDAKSMMTGKCKSAFEKIKKALSSDLSQTHFDPKLNIVIASGASDLGIEAVILHKYNDGSTKPIAHASKFSISAEKNYSQIEKEALAIIFCHEKVP